MQCEHLLFRGHFKLYLLFFIFIFYFSSLSFIFHLYLLFFIFTFYFSSLSFIFHLYLLFSLSEDFGIVHAADEFKAYFD